MVIHCHNIITIIKNFLLCNTLKVPFHILERLRVVCACNIDEPLPIASSALQQNMQFAEW